MRAALRLSREPGWNQVAADWRLMLKVGDSFGLATNENRLVASGLTVPFHSQFGWISMILVTAPFRRRGLATYLMSRCIGALRARGLVPALDATPEGRAVYRLLGFRDVYRINPFLGRGPFRRKQAAAARRKASEDVRGRSCRRDRLRYPDLWRRPQVSH